MLRETGVCQWVDTARWKWHLFCIQHPRDNEYPLLIRHDNGKFARLWMMFPFTCLFSLRIPRPSMLDDTGLDVFQCNPLLCGRVAEVSPMRHSTPGGLSQPPALRHAVGHGMVTFGIFGATSKPSIKTQALQAPCFSQENGTMDGHPPNAYAEPSGSLSHP